MASYTKKLREFGGNGKVTSVSVFCTNLTAANFDAQVALAEAFAGAVNTVQLGTERGEFYSHVVDAGGSSLPTAEQAQRENKWLVSCRETTGGLNAVTFTIPCADLELLATDGENMEDGAERTALISAVEDFVLSNDGNPVVVESIKFRARSR